MAVVTRMRAPLAGMDTAKPAAELRASIRALDTPGQWRRYPETLKDGAVTLRTVLTGAF